MARTLAVHVPGQPQQRGAASLIAVMVLFFIMALAGAYSSRNLIFEQRTSANQYRSTQAIEAAEAGVEWALAMLNGGRIGNNCLEAGAPANATSFRQRYLNVAADGRFTPVDDPDPLAVDPPAPAPPLPLMPSCVFNGTDWACNCPVQGPPVLVAPVGNGPFPAFRVRFSIVDPLVPNVATPVITQPGMVMIEVNGCTRLDEDCLDFPGAAAAQEGRATVYAMVALKSALPVTPTAALTVRDSVAADVEMQVVNTDPDSGGVTVQAGGEIFEPVEMDLQSIPGSHGKSFVKNDELIASLMAPVPPMNPNRVFNSVFGTLPNTYQFQPAAITCPQANCPGLAALVNQNPGRVIWVNGDLVLDTAGDIGSAPDPANPANTGPVVIVATGNVIATANVRIFGFVYSQSGAWIGTPDTPEIQGGAFVEDALEATAGGRIVFNRDVMQHLLHRSGSFVRVPGGWRDFQ